MSGEEETELPGVPNEDSSEYKDRHVGTQHATEAKGILHSFSSLKQHQHNNIPIRIVSRGILT